MSEINVIGAMDNTVDHTFESANRVYGVDGICPTVPTCGGGGIQPKIVEVKKLEAKTICLNSKGGRNGVDGLQPSLQDRVYDPNGISTAITSSFMPNILEVKQNAEYEKVSCPTGFEKFIYEIDGELYLIRIRKLTPRECWRLMGFTDADYEKAASVVSNTQLYKQAGNSIVKQVLMAVFSQMVEPQDSKTVLKRKTLALLDLL